jgi:uncharacterized membrane protein
MELSGELFNTPWLVAMGIGLLPLYWYALKWGDRRRLQEQRLFSPYFGSIVFLLLLWTLRTEVQDGLYWHVSGMVFMTLMWGWSLALIGGGLALFGLTLAGLNDWPGMLPTLWLQVVLPATLTQVVLGLVRAYLPKHFFIFVFINAFFCGGLSAVAAALAASFLLSTGVGYEWKVLSNEYLTLLPLMIFPEAFINGGVTTVLVGLRPQWVWSFSDEEYLQGR